VTVVSTGSVCWFLVLALFANSWYWLSLKLLILALSVSDGKVEYQLRKISYERLFVGMNGMGLCN